MRHFRMPTNQNLKNLAILQKHIGSILKEINKYEDEDRKRAISANRPHGSKNTRIQKGRNAMYISIYNNSTKIRAKKSNTAVGKCIDKSKQLINRTSLICKNCNVISKTVGNHIRHLDTHEESAMSCLNCRKCFQSNDSFTWHLLHLCVGDKNKTVFKCTQCHRTFEEKKDISKHLMGHRRNNCPYCGKPFTLRKLLVKHLVTFHRVLLEKYTMTCNICDKRFLKKRSLYSHLQKHFIDKIVCLQCGYQSLSKEESEEHLKQHNEQKKFRCPTCNVHFTRQQQYLLHMKGHTVYKCITCNQSYGTKQKLLQHKQKGHVVEGLHPRFICPYCPSIFHQKIYLYRHLKKHPQADGGLKCKYCDKSFLALSLYFKHCLLVSHKKFVSEIIKLKCNVCGKMTSKEYLLDRHCYVAHGISKEPFNCQNCDFKTYYKHNYERHELLHTNKEKNFACEHCSKTFHALASLKDHISYNHVQDKKFTCDQCGKSFKRSSELARHLTSHSDSRPFPCTTCGTAFKTTTHLRRHEKSVHQIVPKTKRIKKQPPSVPNEATTNIPGVPVSIETPISVEVSNPIANNVNRSINSDHGYSLHPSLNNTAEDLRLVMQENLVTLGSETLIEDIADPSYDFLVHLTTDEHTDIDILDLSVSEFR